jgi:glycosyltransferase involved in cell wall biosynthesis
MELFHQAHNIDIDKFVFSHWGFDLPLLKNDIFANKDKEYISFVGRNNRDLKTFCHAIKDMDVNGIIITAAYNAPDFILPDNIEIHYDLDMDSCLSCIRHAKINVVLVKDGDRGAGHITIVAAMLMKKPQIISDVAVVKEYFIDGVHGVSVPLADSQRVRDAIVKLKDKEFFQSCGKNSSQYANKYFTNNTSSKRFVDVVQSTINNQKVDVCDPVWLDEFRLIKE